MKQKKSLSLFIHLNGLNKRSVFSQQIRKHAFEKSMNFIDFLSEIGMINGGLFS